MPLDIGNKSFNVRQKFLQLPLHKWKKNGPLPDQGNSICKVFLQLCIDQSVKEIFMVKLDCQLKPLENRIILKQKKNVKQ